MYLSARTLTSSRLSDTVILTYVCHTQCWNAQAIIWQGLFWYSGIACSFSKLTGQKLWDNFTTRLNEHDGSILSSQQGLLRVISARIRWTDESDGSHSATTNIPIQRFLETKTVNYLMQNPVVYGEYIVIMYILFRTRGNFFWLLWIWRIVPVYYLSYLWYQLYPRWCELHMLERPSVSVIA